MEGYVTSVLSFVRSICSAENSFEVVVVPLPLRITKSKRSEDMSVDHCGLGRMD